MSNIDSVHQQHVAICCLAASMTSSIMLPVTNITMP
jgi:hypothetical protein